VAFVGVAKKKMIAANGGSHPDERWQYGFVHMHGSRKEQGTARVRADYCASKGSAEA
jgi:hypothetical protein